MQYKNTTELRKQNFFLKQNASKIATTQKDKNKNKIGDISSL